MVWCGVVYGHKKKKCGVGSDMVVKVLVQSRQTLTDQTVMEDSSKTQNDYTHTIFQGVTEATTPHVLTVQDS